VQRRCVLEEVRRRRPRGPPPSPAPRDRRRPAGHPLAHASSFPKSLDTLFGGAELMARRVGEMTNGKFQISVHAAGEIVPGSCRCSTRLQQGHGRDRHTALYYFYGEGTELGGRHRGSPSG
jgi:TRAP-type mannitol/chloroaromatic compound transport system substrate-binding protein